MLITEQQLATFVRWSGERQHGARSGNKATACSTTRPWRGVLPNCAAWYLPGRRSHLLLIPRAGEVHGRCVACGQRVLAVCYATRLGDCLSNEVRNDTGFGDSNRVRPSFEFHSLSGTSALSHEAMSLGRDVSVL